jgi:hypothetical protein
MATRQGNEYIGKASHFSFWNCDAPFSLVDFKATLKDQDGNPVKRMKVVIKTADDANGPTAYSYTDSAGVVSGWIPAGRKLNLTVLDKCSNVLETKEIGPLSTNTDFGTITITISEDSKITFTGEAVDCLGLPIKNGYAEIGIQGVFERAPIENGLLNYSFIRCGSNNVKANIRIVDVGNDVVGDLKEVDVAGNSVSLDQIIVCDSDLPEYLIYSMDTIRRYFLPPAYNIPVRKHELPDIDDIYDISFYTVDTSNYFVLKFTIDDPGTTITYKKLTVVVNKVYYENLGPFTFNISEFGPEYMTGTITGRLKEIGPSNVSELPINARFRLKIKKP